MGGRRRVASIYRFFLHDPHRANEFHSLALGKLTAERDGKTVWSPYRGGLELKPIPGAPAPADSAAARLRQMRALAQEFTGRQTNRAGVDSDMRLLAQPLYRYENTKGDLIDGGLFGFVQGTDPEVFLLIEARRPRGGAPEWCFGATRMHGIDLRLNHRGRRSGTPPRSPRRKCSTAGSRIVSSDTRSHPKSDETMMYDHPRFRLSDTRADSPIPGRRTDRRRRRRADEVHEGVGEALYVRHRGQSSVGAEAQAGAGVPPGQAGRRGGPRWRDLPLGG